MPQTEVLFCPLCRARLWRKDKKISRRQKALTASLGHPHHTWAQQGPAAAGSESRRAVWQSSASVRACVRGGSFSRCPGWVQGVVAWWKSRDEGDSPQAWQLPCAFEKSRTCLPGLVVGQTAKYSNAWSVSLLPQAAPKFTLVQGVPGS